MLRGALSRARERPGRWEIRPEERQLIVLLLTGLRTTVLRKMLVAQHRAVFRGTAGAVLVWWARKFDWESWNASGCGRRLDSKEQYGM